jgi:hypothetical protein
MRKKAFILMTLAILLGTGAAFYWRLRLPQSEGVCRLETVSSVPYLFKHGISNYFLALDEKPPALSPVPVSPDTLQRYFSIRFKNRTLNCCLIGEEGYILYADLNGDNSFSDEKPLGFRKEFYADNEFIYLFGPLSFADDASTAPFYLCRTDYSAVIHAAPVTVKTGKIRIGDSVHSVMLADLDFDNRYITRFSPECLLENAGWGAAQCDRLLFDLDSDKSFVNAYFERMERTPLCSLIRIDNTFYAVDVMADTLTASPQAVQTGTLKLNTESSSLMLYSDTYCCFVDSRNLVELPAGQYSVIHCQNHFKAPDKSIWTCRSMRTSGPAAQFSISADSRTSVTFPTAFALRTNIAYDQGDCRIGIELVDDSGIVYAAGIQKNYDRTDKPKISVCDSANKVLHTGTMEYG